MWNIDHFIEVGWNDQAERSELNRRICDEDIQPLIGQPRPCPISSLDVNRHVSILNY